MSTTSQKKIFYYSTNRYKDYGGRACKKENFSFAEALFTGQAPDGGLFMPTEYPLFTYEEILSFRGIPYHEVAFFILKDFLSSEIPGNNLKTLTKDVYSFEVPIEQLECDSYIVRLDRGPTASFKDFAARFMARVMEMLKPENKHITILVASSGDTGSAVGKAFRDLKGITVYILYPQSEVSLIQKKQMETIGGNVHAVAIRGKFDDCQNLVKAAFLDRDLKELELTSANSINIGRILPQTVYYFYAYAQVTKEIRPVIFSVPSGNFGNSLGCEIARRMGLPIKKIILATNSNDEFPRFLRTGKYEKIEPSRKCLSNAMNVGNPSNLTRYFDLYGGNLDKAGIVHKDPDLQEMKKNLYSIAINDDETVKTIKQVYRKHKLVIEPHGAVAVAALQEFKKEFKTELTICLETAHPAKFPEILKKELGITPLPPYSLQKLEQKKGKSDLLPADYTTFKKYLLEGGKK